MKQKYSFIYPRLAFSGIRRNARLYVPFCLIAAGMVMIFYIISSLSFDASTVITISNDVYLASNIFTLGWIFLGVFSGIFLFFISTFIIRQRKVEFGMYNILGMGKHNIMMLLIWETLILFSASFIVGILLGILFSRLFFLTLAAMVGKAAKEDFSIKNFGILYDFCAFFAIFGVILKHSLREIRANNSVELFRSDRVGERPPRANWAAAILGVLLLAGGFILIGRLKAMIYGLILFFGGLLLVIVGIYLLFISGSVAVCGLLRKNKEFFYKKKHFLSVSRMSYRMRKNGARLASVCVISSTALVLSALASGFYFGVDKILDERFPRDLVILLASEEPAVIDEFIGSIESAAEMNGTKSSDIITYRLLRSHGYYLDKKYLPDGFGANMSHEEYRETIKKICGVSFKYIPVSDYNRIMGTELSVERGEALVLRLPNQSKEKTYDLLPILSERYETENTEVSGTNAAADRKTAFLKPSGTVSDFVVMEGSELDPVQNSEEEGIGYVSRYVFINDEDFEEQNKLSAARKAEQSDAYGEETTVSPIVPMTEYCIGANFDGRDRDLTELALDIYYDFLEKKGLLYEDAASGGNGSNEAVEQKWEFTEFGNLGLFRDTYETREKYSGLMMLAIIVGIAASASVVVIMYYTQLAEGREDRERFLVLKQIGITNGEILSSVNSQSRAMFLLPLIAACLNTSVIVCTVIKSLPFVKPIGTGGIFKAAVICCAVFTLLYAAVYKLTSRVYYRIVSKQQD